jgi:hypothetical protein
VRLHAARHGEGEVFRDRQVVDVRIRLIRDAETESARLGGRSAPPPTTADLDLAVIRGEESAGDAEQCRLPGPVLPDERVNLACAAVEAHPPERLNGSERLRHVAKGQHEGALGPGTRH